VGHGTYRGTEFTADTLHRIGELMRDSHAERWARQLRGLTEPRNGDGLPGYPGAETESLRRCDGRLTLTRAQADALQSIRKHYDKAFSTGVLTRTSFRGHRGRARREHLADFFFWTHGAREPCGPQELTYTNNWRRIGASATTSPGRGGWSIGALLGVMLASGIACSPLSFDFHKDLEKLNSIPPSRSESCTCHFQQPAQGGQVFPGGCGLLFFSSTWAG